MRLEYSVFFVNQNHARFHRRDCIHAFASRMLRVCRSRCAKHLTTCYYMKPRLHSVPCVPECALHTYSMEESRRTTVFANALSTATGSPCHRVYPCRTATCQRCPPPRAYYLSVRPPRRAPAPQQCSLSRRCRLQPHPLCRTATCQSAQPAPASTHHAAYRLKGDHSLKPLRLKARRIHTSTVGGRYGCNEFRSNALHSLKTRAFRTAKETPAAA